MGIRTHFDDIEGITGTLSERGVTRLSERGLGMLREPLDALRPSGPTVSLPPRGISEGPGEHLRPYLSRTAAEAWERNSTRGGSHRPDFTAGHLECFIQGYARSSDVDRVISAVTRDLLYCHSVVIDDPLTHYLAKVETAARWGGSVPSGEDVAEGLEGCLRLLSAMRPLLRARRVLLLPSTRKGVRHWDTKLFRDLNTLIGMFERDEYHYTFAGRSSFPDGEFFTPPVSELSKVLSSHVIIEFLERHKTVEQRDPLWRALDDVSEQVRVYVHSRGNVDFSSPGGELQEIALAGLLQEAENERADQNGLRRLEVLRQETLASLPVLALEGLAPHELLRLHEDSEAFAQWRSALAVALDRLRSEFEPGSPLVEERAARILGESLWPALSSLRSQLGGSGQSLVVTGLQTVVYGLVPVAASAVSESLVTGAAAAAVVGGVQAVWTYVAGKASRDTASVAKHLQRMLGSD